jgi:hypothetical protein
MNDLSLTCLPIQGTAKSHLQHSFFVLENLVGSIDAWPAKDGVSKTKKTLQRLGKRQASNLRRIFEG